MYKLEDKEYQFKRVSVQDALRLKSAITMMSKENATSQQLSEADEVITEICVKHLEVKIDGKMFESVENLEFLETVFVNPFAIVEIVANFQEMISGFIQSLPKFQSVGKTAKRK